MTYIGTLEASSPVYLSHTKIMYESDEQNRQKELPTNKANGNQKSLGHLKGAKTIARGTPRLQKVWKRQIRRNAEAVWQNGRSESLAERRSTQQLGQRYGPAY